MTRLLFSGLIISLFVSHVFHEQLTPDTSCDKFVSHNFETGVFDTLSVNNDTKLTLDFIYPFPFGYGGGDFFTYDTTAIIPNKFPNRFIFISNLMDSAVIRIKGKDVYLIKDTINSIARRQDDTWQEVWKGKGYTIILKMKVLKDEDESIYSKGILEIITTKFRKKFKVHGNSET